MSTELSSSSYELDVSANVYRIAAMTVALDAGFWSLIRSYRVHQIHLFCACGSKCSHAAAEGTAMGASS